MRNFDLSVIASKISTYIKDEFNQSRRRKYAGYRAAQALFALGIINSSSKILDDNIKAILLKAVAESIDSTNIGWGSKIRRLLNKGNSAELNFDSQYIPDGKLKGIDSLYSKFAGSQNHTIKALHKMLDRVMRSRTLTELQKQVALDEWIAVVKTLYQDQSAVPPATPLGKVIQYAKENRDSASLNTQTDLLQLAAFGHIYSERSRAVEIKRIEVRGDAAKIAETLTDRLKISPDYLGFTARLYGCVNKIIRELDAFAHTLSPENKENEINKLRAILKKIKTSVDEDKTLNSIVKDIKEDKIQSIHQSIKALEKLGYPEAVIKSLVKQLDAVQADLEVTIFTQSEDSHFSDDDFIKINQKYRSLDLSLIKINERIELLKLTKVKIDKINEKVTELPTELTDPIYNRKRALLEERISVLNALFSADGITNASFSQAINDAMAEVEKRMNDIQLYNGLVLEISLGLSEVDAYFSSEEFKLIKDIHGIKELMISLLINIRGEIKAMASGEVVDEKDMPDLSALKIKFNRLKEGLELYKQAPDLVKKINLLVEEVGKLQRISEIDGSPHKTSANFQENMQLVSEKIFAVRTNFLEKPPIGPALELTAERLDLVKSKHATVDSELTVVTGQVAKIKKDASYVDAVRSSIKLILKSFSTLKNYVSKFVGLGEEKSVKSGRDEKSMLAQASKYSAVSKKSSDVSVEEKHYQKKYADITRHLPEDEAEQLVLAAPKDKDKYKAYAYRVIRSKLINFKILVDTFIVEKSSFSSVEVPQEILDNFARRADEINERKKQIESLLRAVKGNYNAYKINNSKLINHSLQFTPLLKQFETEFADLRGRVFDSELGQLELEVTEEDKHYERLAAELKLADIKETDLTKSDHNEVYVYKFVRLKLAQLRDLAEDMAIAKQKMLVKPGSLADSRDLQQAKNAFYEAINQLEPSIQKIQHKSPGEFASAFKKMADQFYVFKHQIFSKFFELPISEKRYQEKMAKLNFEEEYASISGWETLENQLNETKEAEYEVRAYFYFTKSLTTLKTQSQEIIALQKKLIDSQKILSRQDTRHVNDKINRLRSLIDHFDEKLEGAQQLMGVSEDFILALDKFEKDFKLFESSIMSSIDETQQGLEEFVLSMEKQQQVIDQDLFLLTKSNPARSQEEREYILSLSETELRELHPLAISATDPTRSALKPEVKSQPQPQSQSAVAPKAQPTEEKKPVKVPDRKKEKFVLSDEKAFDLLVQRDKELKEEKRPRKLPAYDELQAAVRDIVAHLEINSSKMIKFSPTVKAVIEKCQDDKQKFVISPKAFLYANIGEIERAIHESDPSHPFDMSCVAEMLAFKETSYAFLLAVRKMAFYHPENFKNLNDKTIVWIAKMSHSLLSADMQSQEEFKLLQSLDVQLQEREKGLKNDKTEQEIYKIVFEVIESMLYPTGAIDSLLTSKQKVDELRRQIVAFCKNYLIISVDSQGEEQAARIPGLGAHRLMAWVDRVMEWKEPKIADPTMLDFAKKLRHKITEMRSETGDYLSLEARAESAPGAVNLVEVNKNIRDNLQQTFSASERNKDSLLAAVKLLCSEEDMDQKYIPTWKAALKKLNFTNDFLHNFRLVSSAAKILDFINRAIRVLCDDSAIKKIFVAKQAKFSSEISPLGTLEYDGNPPQLRFVDPKNQLYTPPKVQTSIFSQPIEGDDTDQQRQVQMQLQVQPMPPVSLDQHEEKVKDRHQQVLEIEQSASEVFTLFKRLQVLIESQTSGTVGYDMMLLSLEPGADIIAAAKEASKKNDKNHYPVLIKQEEKIYIYGNAKFKKWKGDDLILMSINPQKIPVETMHALEKERTPIITKWRDKFSLLKFNGKSWEAIGLKSTSELNKLVFPTDKNPLRHDSCAVPLHKEIVKRGGNKHWRLTEVPSLSPAMIQELAFPPPGEQELVQGFEIDRGVYKKITAVKGHLAPAINTLLASIEHAKDQSEQADENVTSASNAQSFYIKYFEPIEVAVKKWVGKKALTPVIGSTAATVVVEVADMTGVTRTPLPF